MIIDVGLRHPVLAGIQSQLVKQFKDRFNRAALEYFFI